MQQQKKRDRKPGPSKYQLKVRERNAALASHQSSPRKVRDEVTTARPAPRLEAPDKVPQRLHVTPSNSGLEPQMTPWPTGEDSSRIHRCYYLLIRPGNRLRIVATTSDHHGDDWRRFPCFNVHHPQERYCREVADFGSSYVNEWFSTAHDRSRLECIGGGYLPLDVDEKLIPRVWTMAWYGQHLRRMSVPPGIPPIHAEWVDVTPEVVATFKPSCALVFSLAAEGFKHLFPDGADHFDEVARVAREHYLADKRNRR